MQDVNNQTTLISRGELWEQLSRAIELRSSQDQVLWSIFGFFGATNAILLVALFTDGEFPKDPWVAAVVVGAGLLLSLTWHFIQARALGHIKRHEALMESIERELRLPPELAVSAEINRASINRHVGVGIPARKVMARCGLVSSLLWGGVVIIYLGKSFNCL